MADSHASSLVQALPAPQGSLLWLIDLQHEPEPAHWAACDADEQARAGRFRFEVHARRYRAAHAAMRQIMGAQLGVHAASLRWRIGARDKPHLQDHAGWHFNLSHSGDWALLGMSPSLPIGVDIECHKEMRDMAGIVGHQFSAVEQAAYARLHSGDQTDWFFSMWSRKEACLKALGSGLSVSSQTFDVDASQACVDTAVPVNGQLCAMTVHDVPLPAHIEAKAAVALVHAGSHHLANAF
ncbi:MAG: 4'-phosphopantetheinyl transferase superfamily protein [Aquabacterium sp.]